VVRPGLHITGRSTTGLTVQSEVLRKRLTDEHLEACLDEVSDAPRVAVTVARCEALVSAVEDRKEMAFSANLNKGKRYNHE